HQREEDAFHGAETAPGQPKPATTLKSEQQPEGTVQGRLLQATAFRKPACFRPRVRPAAPSAGRTAPRVSRVVHRRLAAGGVPPAGYAGRPCLGGGSAPWWRGLPAATAGAS